jgi:glycosyltransferase involved in cell wall biosynthesis
VITSINNDKKHLVWVTTTPFEYLGITTWLFTTQELRKLGWKVTLIAPDLPGIHEKLGVEYVGIPMPHIYLIRQLIYHARVNAFIRRLDQKPDVVMFHEISVPVYWLARLFRDIRGRKQPLYVQDIRTLPMQPAEISSFKDRLRGRFFFLVNWLANRGGVDGRVAITGQMAKALNIPEDKLWGVWTSGVNLELFSQAAGKRSWQDVDHQVNIIYIGSMSDGRNLTLFGRAVAEANRQGMNFSMTYIGEGTEMDDLLKLEKEAGGCIRVLPSIPHDQIQDWLARGHIGILPFPDELKFRVSSPIKLFEYAASGLAIMATRIVCHTDVIGDGKYVIWAEESTLESLVDALHRAWENRKSLHEMGDLARQESPRWTWAESAANLGRALDHGLSKYGY